MGDNKYYTLYFALMYLDSLQCWIFIMSKYFFICFGSWCQADDTETALCLYIFSYVVVPDVKETTFEMTSFNFAPDGW